MARAILTAILVMLLMFGSWYFCKYAQAEDVAINPMHKSIAEKYVIRTLRLKTWKAPKIKLVDNAELAYEKDSEKALRSRWARYMPDTGIILIDRAYVADAYARGREHFLISVLGHEMAHDVHQKNYGYDLTDKFDILISEKRARMIEDNYLVSNGITPERKHIEQM